MTIKSMFKRPFLPSFEVGLKAALFFCVLHLLNQDVSHRFDVLIAIISPVLSFVTTRVGIIIVPSSAKPDSGVTRATDILIVGNDTNSRFRAVAIGA